MVLDNTISGTREERGLHVWAQYSQGSLDWWEDDRLHLASSPHKAWQSPHVIHCSLRLHE